MKSIQTFLGRNVRVVMGFFIGMAIMIGASQVLAQPAALPPSGSPTANFTDVNVLGDGHIYGDLIVDGNLIGVSVGTPDPLVIGDLSVGNTATVGVPSLSGQLDVWGDITMLGLGSDIRIDNGGKFAIGNGLIDTYRLGYPDPSSGIYGGLNLGVVNPNATGFAASASWVEDYFPSTALLAGPDILTAGDIYADGTAFARGGFHSWAGGFTTPKGFIYVGENNNVVGGPTGAYGPDWPSIQFGDIVAEGNLIGSNAQIHENLHTAGNIVSGTDSQNFTTIFESLLGNHPEFATNSPLESDIFALDDAVIEDKLFVMNGIQSVDGSIFTGVPGGGDHYYSTHPDYNFTQSGTNSNYWYPSPSTEPDLYSTDDIFADDDLYVGDDVSIGGDLTVTGTIIGGLSLTSSDLPNPLLIGTTTYKAPFVSGDVVAQGRLISGNDAFVNNTITVGNEVKASTIVTNGGGNPTLPSANLWETGSISSTNNLYVDNSIFSSWDGTNDWSYFRTNPDGTMRSWTTDTGFSIHGGVNATDSGAYSGVGGSVYTSPNSSGLQARGYLGFVDAGVYYGVYTPDDMHAEGNITSESGIGTFVMVSQSAGNTSTVTTQSVDCPAQSIRISCGGYVNNVGSTFQGAYPHSVSTGIYGKRCIAQRTGTAGALTASATCFYPSLTPSEAQTTLNSLPYTSKVVSPL